MGFFGRLLGIESEADRRPPRVAVPPPDSDAQAVERYRYMLRTAPPETLEQAYAEAFAKLSPEQRERLRSELASSAPDAERSTVAATPVQDPQALARVATRAEIRQPGVMERSLGAMGGGGMGMGASMLSSFAMGFVGSMVAQSFLSAIGGFPGAPTEDADPPPDEQALAENEDASSDDFGDDGGDFEV